MHIELCGYKVLIDDEDYEKLPKTKCNVKIRRNGYIYFYYRKYSHSKFLDGDKNCYECIFLHRFLCGIKYRDKEIVDHINGNTLDNRKCNLRICTNAENLRNQKRSKRNKTGYKGVSFDKNRKKYKACIRVNGIGIFLGRFNNPIVAYEAYCEASKKYHGEFGRTE
jgi:hypothetical protein